MRRFPRPILDTDSLDQHPSLGWLGLSFDRDARELGRVGRFNASNATAWSFELTTLEEGRGAVWRQMPSLAPSRQAHFLSARVVSGSADGSINPSHSLRGGASLATAPCGMGALRAAPFLYDKKGIS